MEFIIIAWLWVTVYFLAAATGQKNISDMTVKDHFDCSTLVPILVIPTAIATLTRRVFNV